MDRYAIRTLRRHPLRLVLTVGGVSLCVVLMFFLLAVYRGAADGSVEHVRRPGFLPLLYAVAVIGVVVLTAILSLVLSVNILERQKDFAILKTLGAPLRFLWGLVAEQALLIASISGIAALVLFFPLVRAIERISPEVGTKTTPGQILAVLAAVEIMSLASSLISLRRLRRIYYLEVFA